jgi:uncharacterized protein
MLSITHANATLPSGDDIANSINARNEGTALSRNLTMEMIDRRGKKRTRKTRAFRKYYGDEKKTVIHYLSPRNVKKTAFLTFDYPQANKDDDQWLYLPAMRKVRRISASDRGDYFLGTDFTYEDIKKESKVSIEDYNRTSIRKDKVDDFNVYVMESVPVDQETANELGYGRVIQWVDSKIWMIRKSNIYDTKGNPLKTIYTKDIRKIDGIWTAHRLEAINHKTGHKTIFTFEGVVYEKEVRDDLFTQRAIRHGL